MTTAIEQMAEFFETKKMIEKRENKFLSALIELEEHLLKADADHLFPEKEGSLGCYFKLNKGAKPEVLVDPSSGDLMLNSPIMYRKDHEEIDLCFSVNDSVLYAHVDSDEGDILILNHFGKVSEEFIAFLRG
jgi:hypothetical protein